MFNIIGPKKLVVLSLWSLLTKWVEDTKHLILTYIGFYIIYLWLKLYFETGQESFYVSGNGRLSVYVHGEPIDIEAQKNEFLASIVTSPKRY